MENALAAVSKNQFCQRFPENACVIFAREREREYKNMICNNKLYKREVKIIHHKITRIPIRIHLHIHTYIHTYIYIYIYHLLICLFNIVTSLPIP